MQFFIILVIATLVGWAMPARFGGRLIQDAMRRAMAVALVFTGVSHLAMPDSFLVYFPGWVLAPEAIVYVTGLAEIAGGLALFVRRYRSRIGLALAAYLVLIFPANVYAAVAGVDEALPGLVHSSWYPWVRLPFQAIFVWWALRSTAEPAASRQSIRPLRLVATGR